MKRERGERKACKRLRILADSPRGKLRSGVRIPAERAQPRHGGVAQLGEHLPCKQGVRGSNPLISISREEQERSCEMGS